MEISKLVLIIVVIVGFLGGLFLGQQWEDLFDDDDDDEGGSPGQVIVDAKYEPDINPDDYVAGIDHTYFPMVPGTTMTYEGENEDGKFSFIVDITNQTKEVMGVTCMVIRDREWEGDELVEDTFDWFAQDKDGNVWYFGEDSTEFDDGEESKAGSWEAGVDGAYPGIIMLANPMVGLTYRQEYYEGEAEDMGTIIAMGEKKTVAYGSFEDCLIIQDSTALEPDVAEYKYYAPGVGVIHEEAIKGEDEYAELVSIE